MKKFVLVFTFISFCPNLFTATEFNVDRSKKNIIKFISDAPLEDIEGITNLIDGYMYWEATGTTSNSQLYFEVDLNTLDTGIGLRNRHMRENYLETDKFQYASYAGKFSAIKKISEAEYEVEVDGTFNIHGITKPMPLKGKLIKTDNGFRIKSEFGIKLSDYKIEIPQLMFMKINELIQLHVDFNIKQIN